MKTMHMKNILKTCLVGIGLLSLGSAGAQTKVGFYTSMGDFKIELTDDLTPITVDSFLARVTEGFYDGLIFHRVIDNFMIQGGDPLGNGTGGPGYTIPDEFDPTLKNVPGALAMANAGPNTGGSQFFINLVTNAHLDNHHTVFGMVTEGFSVVQSIGHVPTNSADRPLTDVVIDSIRVLEYPTSLSDVAIRNGLSIYPNPFREVIHISSPVPVDAYLSGIDGRIISHMEDVKTIPVKDLAKGMYLLQIRDKGGKLVKVEKMVRQ